MRMIIHRARLDRLFRWMAILTVSAAAWQTVSEAEVRLLSPSGPVSESSGGSLTTNRLAALAVLWGDVKYHHPALAFRSDIDWDSALLGAIPKVRKARSLEDFETSLQEMLDALDDPATRVIRTADLPGEEPGAGQSLTYERTADGVLVVKFGDYHLLAGPDSQAALVKASAEMGSARALVLDVRTRRGLDPFGRFWLSESVARFYSGLTRTPLGVAGELRRVFYGYSAPSAFSSGQYRGGLFTRAFPPIRPAPNAREIPSVLLLNRFSALPEGAVPLQAAGRGLVVLEAADPSIAVTGGTHRVDLGEGLTAEVRESELVLPDGSSGRLIPDLVVAGKGRGSDPGLTAALELARQFHPSTVHRPRLPATIDPAIERSYRDLVELPLEHRLLALFRFWNVIRYFYPYHRLLEPSWDGVLPELIPRFIDATDSAAYAEAVAGLASRLHDSHAYVAGGGYTKMLLPQGYPPIRVRIVEGLPVVVACLYAEAVDAGVEVGDIVTEVDGEEALGRLRRYASLISASTPQSLFEKAALSFMNGPVDSRVEIVLRGRDGKSRTVGLTRRHEDFTTLYHRERTGPVIRILEGNIGYADLDRLSLDQVDEMFEQLGGTKAIVFDMRGYPEGTIWAIAPRLTSSQPRVALLETPLVGHDSPGDASGTVFEAFRQTINPTPPGQSVYTGRTVMLMDGRTVSQAEHTGLYLRAANGTLFVGSPTAGADGEVATVVLPGGITVGFTGQSVRFPDGTELQRRGLIPDIAVSPTIQGLREGRDEVLEAAVRHLSR